MRSDRGFTLRNSMRRLNILNIFFSKRHQDRVDPAPDHVDSKGVAVEGTMRFLLVLVLPLRDLPTQTVCIQKYFGGNWTLSVW